MSDDYIQFNPPRNHPSWDEWQKVKEKRTIQSKQGESN